MLQKHADGSVYFPTAALSYYSVLFQLCFYVHIIGQVVELLLFCIYLHTQLYHKSQTGL